MSPRLPWWTPDKHADRRAFLLGRMRIKAALRQWFTTQGFVEVETACLQLSPGNETHLHAFKSELIAPDLTHHSVYLHTSPEFACKKLLAAGEEKIVTFAPVFRNRERSALHHPEFTMLEWYRANASYDSVMADCSTILAAAAEAAGMTWLSFRGRTCDPFAAPEILTVDQAFSRYAGFDVLSTLTASRPDRNLLAERAMAAGIAVRHDDNWSDIFSKSLVALVEPRLGIGHPTLLAEYPVTEAALARPKADDHRVAERFELYVCGVEVANGFGELTDPTVMRWRFEAEMEEKLRLYGEQYPIDEDLIQALAHMPPASGVALGFDRLVMLATGADRVEQVIWTPVAIPETP